MKYTDNIGLQFLAGVLFSIIFLITRMKEGHFGNWSEAAIMLMFLGPTVIPLISDKIKRDKRKP